MCKVFVDDGLEVSQGADRPQRRQVRRPDQPAHRTQQQGRFDGSQRDAAVMRPPGLPVILKVCRQWRLRQFGVRQDDSGHIGIHFGFWSGRSHFFLRRAAVSSSLSRTRYLLPSITVTSA